MQQVTSSVAVFLIWSVLFAFAFALVLSPVRMRGLMLRASIRREADYPRWVMHPNTTRIFGVIFLISLVLILTGLLI
jgi:hypothetical protein